MPSESCPFETRFKSILTKAPISRLAGLGARSFTVCPVGARASGGATGLRTVRRPRPEATDLLSDQFDSLGDRQSSDPAVHFGTFLRDLLSAVPNAVLNRGALAVRENQAETCPRYPTRNAFVQETQWLLWSLRGAGGCPPSGSD